MIQNNSYIATDGLIFSLDSSNIKSYTGPVMTNIATEISPRGISDNGSSFRFFSGTDTDYIPSVGNTTYSYVDMYNDYGSSGNCCPSPFGYGQGISVTGNTVYTYGILYRSANRYTNANLMYHYEYNGGTYLTEFGVHGNGAYSWQETDLGNGWYWSRAKFTSQPSATLFYTGSWMYQYSTWNRWEVAKILISPGDWTNVHPIYWPAVGTSRSNTQNLSDLTNNNTITAQSLTYAADGTFSFNGSQYLSIPDSALIRPSSGYITTEVWFKATATGGQNASILINKENEYEISAGGGYITYAFRPNWAWVGATAFNTNQIYCLTITYDQSYQRMYLNGVEVYSAALTGPIGNAYSDTLKIGARGGSGSTYDYFTGNIYNVKIYNRALTPSEVAQNFNALRGRYGL